LRTLAASAYTVTARSILALHIECTDHCLDGLSGLWSGQRRVGLKYQGQ